MRSLAFGILLAVTALCATARAQCNDCMRMGTDPKFFAGGRMGVVVPQGAKLLTNTFGVELGLATRGGAGFGIHLLTALDTPAFGGIPSVETAFGALFDIRWYLQALDAVAFYPVLALGFALGKDTDGTNVNVPLVNFGAGGRLWFNPLYVSVEFGYAVVGPYLNFSLGWQAP